MKNIPLTHMNAGEAGEVVEFLGGHGLRNRLYVIGIRPGVRITKVSTGFARGPVVVKAGGTQTAIGFGMSNKIIVEVNR